MKTILLFAFVLTGFSSCSTSDHKQSNILELKEIAKLALNKPVKFVIDSLQLNVDELTFVDEPPGIISSISVDYNNKGAIEFFFKGCSVIADTLRSKEHFLSKVAGKTIDEIAWKNVDGTKGSLKNVKIY